MCDSAQLANALQGKTQRSGGMNLPELIACARARGLDVKNNISRSKLVSMINPSQVKKVTLPTTITQVLKTLPVLMREYGGIMDFKLDGSFETMSMVPGENTYVQGKDIPDYEVIWHNHPAAEPGYISEVSLDDTMSLIQRKHTQYSLIFTDKGTFVQWVPDRVDAKQRVKLFLQVSKKSMNAARQLYNDVTYNPDIPVPYMEQFTAGIKNYFGVETRFIPWGQPVTLNIVPYEPVIHRARLTKGQKAKKN